MTSGIANEYLVRAWMSPPEHCVSQDERVDEAFRQLKEARIRHLLVLDREGELCGVVTDRDLRRPDWNGGTGVLSVAQLYRLGDRPPICWRRWCTSPIRWRSRSGSVT